MTWNEKSLGRKDWPNVYPTKQKIVIGRGSYSPDYASMLKLEREVSNMAQKTVQIREYIPCKVNYEGYLQEMIESKDQTN